KIRKVVYTLEFMLEAVRRVRSGRTGAQGSNALGAPPQNLKGLLLPRTLAVTALRPSRWSTGSMPSHGCDHAGHRETGARWHRRGVRRDRDGRQSERLPELG